LRKQDYWQDLYSFDLTHVGAADILLGNHFTATCAESFFTFARVATLPIPGGRLSLMNFSLKITQGGREQLRELPPGPAYLEALAEHFGIQLDAPYEQLRPVRT
jgi:N-hydroxyarylamine O-acetyltransferase